MGRPVIGVTSAPRMANVAGHELSVEALTERFVQMLISAGAAPVILPVHAISPEDVVGRLDGITLSGGGDVDPLLYRQHSRAEVYGVDPERDRFEVELVHQAVEADLPLFAICRGIQMLNVAMHGSLIQDIQAELTDALEHRQPGRWEEPSHEIRIDPKSSLGQIVGERARVNSLHHQAVAQPGPGLRPVAWAPDGVIEAVEGEGMRFCLGLQWHPEYLGSDHPTFQAVRAFVAAAGERGP